MEYEPHGRSCVSVRGEYGGPCLLHWTPVAPATAMACFHTARYIIKPSAGSEGAGIVLVQHEMRLPLLHKPAVAQEYIVIVAGLEPERRRCHRPSSLALRRPTVRAGAAAARR